MEVIYEPEDKKSIYAIAGGKNPKAYFTEMRFTDEQLDDFLTRVEKVRYIEEKQYECNGSLNLYSSLYALVSEDKPVILYTAEDGTRDSCLGIFLKYGEGRRPDLHELEDRRECMDDYHGDIKGVVRKIYKIMEMMLPADIYVFEHCYGVMADMGGNFTWSRYQNHNYLPCGSPDTHSHMTMDNLNLISLVSSQPPDSYEEEKVEYYRKKIRKGKRLGCVACYIEHVSNYAIILDGHHRVLASMLEGVYPDCLMISPAHYKLKAKNGKTYLNIQTSFENNIDVVNLPEKVTEILRKDKITMKKFSDEEKLAYYQFYRNNTVDRGTYLPEKYESAANEMIYKSYMEQCPPVGEISQVVENFMRS